TEHELRRRHGRPGGGRVPEPDETLPRVGTELQRRLPRVRRRRAGDAGPGVEPRGHCLSAQRILRVVWANELSASIASSASSVMYASNSRLPTWSVTRCRPRLDEALASAYRLASAVAEMTPAFSAFDSAGVRTASGRPVMFTPTRPVGSQPPWSNSPDHTTPFFIAQWTWLKWLARVTPDVLPRRPRERICRPPFGEYRSSCEAAP